MPEGYPWYGAVDDACLEQGDLLRDCPSFRLKRTVRSRASAATAVC
jgi:hypothetical protein